LNDGTPNILQKEVMKPVDEVTYVTFSLLYSCIHIKHFLKEARVAIDTF
jgi:hypothetical protein